MSLSLVYFVKVIHQREVIENFVEGEYFCYPKTGVVHFKSKLLEIKKIYFICVNKK